MGTFAILAPSGTVEIHPFPASRLPRLALHVPNPGRYPCLYQNRLGPSGRRIDLRPRRFSFPGQRSARRGRSTACFGQLVRACGHSFEIIRLNFNDLGVMTMKIVRHQDSFNLVGQGAVIML